MYWTLTFSLLNSAGRHFLKALGRSIFLESFRLFPYYNNIIYLSFSLLSLDFHRRCSFMYTQSHDCPHYCTLLVNWNISWSHVVV